MPPCGTCTMSGRGWTRSSRHASSWRGSRPSSHRSGPTETMRADDDATRRARRWCPTRTLRVPRVRGRAQRQRLPPALHRRPAPRDAAVLAGAAAVAPPTTAMRTRPRGNRRGHCHRKRPARRQSDAGAPAGAGRPRSPPPQHPPVPAGLGRVRAVGPGKGGRDRGRSPQPVHRLRRAAARPVGGDRTRAHRARRGQPRPSTRGGQASGA